MMVVLWGFLGVLFLRVCVFGIEWLWSNFFFFFLNHLKWPVC